NDSGADVHRADLVLELVPGNIAGAAQFEQAGPVNHEAVGAQWRRVAVTTPHRGRPQLLARLWVVTLEFEGHAEDELVLVADAGDDRRAPGAEKPLTGQPRVAAGLGCLP